jgi:membrane-associated PAP2 superfamily phosphatase
MNRNGLLVALGVAAAVGLIFGFFPDLDLRISRPFYENIDAANNAFALRIHPALMALREAGIWVVAAVVAPAIFALVLKLILPRRRLLISARAIVFLTTTLMLAPGLVANIVLKDHWGRSRPIDVTPLGGTDRFVAWWDPRGECPTNCSFVSGDVSAAFWTIAPAALAPPTWRPLAYAGALVFGTGMAFLRMVAGGHFFSDVAFSGAFTFLIIWLVHGLIYRWPATRLADEAIERSIERLALAGQRKATAARAGLAAFLHRHMRRRSPRQG